MGIHRGGDKTTVFSTISVDSGTLDIDEVNDRVGIGTTSPKTKLTVEGAVTLKEQSNADADTGAYGQLWVKTATPNELYFTTDAGDDIQITTGTSTSGGGAVSAINNATANELVTIGATTTELDAETNLTFDGSTLSVTGDISASGNLYSAAFVYHVGDTDTSLKFTNDQINLTAGNINMLKIKEDTQDSVVWFEDGNDVDFRIEVPGQAYFFWIDAGNDKLYIGGNTASKLTSDMVNFQDGNIGIGRNSADNVGSEINFAKSRHATDGNLTTIVQSGDSLGEINWKGADGDSLSFACQIKGVVGYGTPADADMPGKLVFSTTADGAGGVTEAMRISQGQGVVIPNGGICCMGYNSGNEIADSASTTIFSGIFMDYGALAGLGRILINGHSGAAIGTFQLRQQANDNDPGVTTLSLDTSNNATFLGSVTENSDSRLKANVRPLGDNTLAKVMSLRPVNFNRIAQPTDSVSTSREYTGFIAQELGVVLPDLIHTNPGNSFGVIEDMQAIATKELIPILTKALQEQQAVIVALTARVTALEN